METFLVKIRKFDVDGSKAYVVELGFIFALYSENNPILAPISQKIKLYVLLKLLIQSIVSFSKKK